MSILFTFRSSTTPKRRSSTPAVRSRMRCRKHSRRRRSSSATPGVDAANRRSSLRRVLWSSLRRGSRSTLRRGRRGRRRGSRSVSRFPSFQHSRLTVSSDRSPVGRTTLRQPSAGTTLSKCSARDGKDNRESSAATRASLRLSPSCFTPADVQRPQTRKEGRRQGSLQLK
jgi:hypothetical protein